MALSGIASDLALGEIAARLAPLRRCRARRPRRRHAPDSTSFGGGSTLTEAKQILVRQAVAALLNSAHPNVDFSLTTAEVVAPVNAALASGDRGTILELAEELASANEAGCP